MGLFSLKKKRLRGDLSRVYKYVMAESKEDRAAALSLGTQDKMRGNEALTERQEVVEMVRYWHRLPRLVVGSPSLEVFTSHVDAVKCSVLYLTWGGVGRGH